MSSEQVKFSSFFDNDDKIIVVSVDFRCHEGQISGNCVSSPK